METLTEEWARANPGSRAHHERAARVLPGGLTRDVQRMRPFPLCVTRAAGSRKWDADGHELVCYVMGHGALLFGHSYPPVVEAIATHAGDFLHAGACHAHEAAWAEEIARLVPSAQRVRLTSSGTEATLLALHVARAASGRTRVLEVEGHFHGWHDYAAVGSEPPYDVPATPGLPRGVVDAVTVVPPDLEALERELIRRDAAAVILEPTGASWGGIPLPAGFVSQLRERTAETGTLLVFDEVVTGFRWSPGGAQALLGVTPDLTALAKIVAGGLPGGALAGRADLLDLIAFRGPDDPKVAHSGTHNGHPLSAVAGCATLRALADGAVHAHADALAARLRDGLNDVLRRHGAPGFVHGQSSTFKTVLGHEGPLEATDPLVLKHGVTGPLSDALHCGMLLHGVHLFHGDGFLSGAHTDVDADLTIEAFDRVIPRLQAEGLL